MELAQLAEGIVIVVAIAAFVPKATKDVTPAQAPVAAAASAPGPARR